MEGYTITPQKGFLDQRLPADDKKSWYLWVLTSADSQYSRLRWNVYQVDADQAKSLAGLKGRLSIQVSLRDGNGEEIASEEVSLGSTVSNSTAGEGLGGRSSIVDREGGLCWIAAEAVSPLVRSSKQRDTPPAPHITIAPLMMKRSRTYSSEHTIDFAPTLKLVRKVKLSESDLKRLKDIKCTVVFHPDKGAE
jgi:hypothetical protein